MRNYHISRGGTAAGRPNPTDVFVGSKLREFAMQQNVSQSQSTATVKISKFLPYLFCDVRENLSSADLY